MQKVQSVSELALQIAADPDLEKAVKANPVQTLMSLAAPLQSDVWIYRMVVGALGLTVLAAVIGGIALAVIDKAVPDVLVALGSGGLGALAGLLAPSPMSRQ